MTVRDIDREAQEWADVVWDESDLDPLERSMPETIGLAKESGKMGYKAGYSSGAKSRWISVEERLPQKNLLVLILREDNMIFEGFCWEHEGKFGWTNETDAEVELKKITHWQYKELPDQSVSKEGEKS